MAKLPSLIRFTTPGDPIPDAKGPIQAEGAVRFETSAKSHFVILSEAKDLVFSRTSETLRRIG
jgi:hypothetical protein